MARRKDPLLDLNINKYKTGSVEFVSITWDVQQWTNQLTIISFFCPPPFPFHPPSRCGKQAPLAWFICSVLSVYFRIWLIFSWGFSQISFKGVQDCICCCLLGIRSWLRGIWSKCVFSEKESKNQLFPIPLKITLRVIAS